jgi:hypothetical protein
VSLKTSLKRFSESLASVFRGKDGVERFLESGPPVEEAEAAPGFRAMRFALARGVDPETVTPVDVEEVRGYFLTSENEPRRRLSPPRCRRGFSTPLPTSATARRSSRSRARSRPRYRQWIREKDFYAVRQIHALYRHAATRFAAQSARAGSSSPTCCSER